MSAWLNTNRTRHWAHQVAYDLFHIARLVDANDSKAMIGKMNVERFLRRCILDRVIAWWTKVWRKASINTQLIHRWCKRLFFRFLIFSTFFFLFYFLPRFDEKMEVLEGEREKEQRKISNVTDKAIQKRPRMTMWMNRACRKLMLAMCIHLKLILDEFFSLQFLFFFVFIYTYFLAFKWSLFWHFSITSMWLNRITYFLGADSHYFIDWIKLINFFHIIKFFLLFFLTLSAKRYCL